MKGGPPPRLVFALEFFFRSLEIKFGRRTNLRQLRDDHFGRNGEVLIFPQMIVSKIPST